MKPIRALLAASLVANAAFAVLLIWRPAVTRTFLHDAFLSRPALEQRATSKTAAPVAPRNPAPADTTELPTINWGTLQPADYAMIRARLETMGFPADTTRAVIAVLVMKDYNERQRVLRRQPDPAEYWRNPNPRPDPQELAAIRELDREKSKMLRELVGPDFDFEDGSATQRRRFGNLPEEKIARLKKIFSDYSDLEEQLFVDGSDRGSPENRARSALLAKEKRSDIERLLTPEELLDYDLRNSNAANRLRGKIGSFAATEAEFRALYPTFNAVVESETNNGFVRGNAAEMRRAREAAERQLDAELRRVLGETRYAGLQEANDYALQQTRAFAASLNLPPAAAAEVIAVQQEFQPRLAAVERDRDLSPNQRDAQLAALGNEARNRLTRVLGAEGFESYKRRGGSWLGAAITRSAPSPSGIP